MRIEHTVVKCKVMKRHNENRLTQIFKRRNSRKKIKMLSIVFILHATFEEHIQLICLNTHFLIE